MSQCPLCRPYYLRVQPTADRWHRQTFPLVALSHALLGHAQESIGGHHQCVGVYADSDEGVR